MAATVTVATLFTDLVDSTAVASRLGPEASEELRREHFALLRAAAGAADGTEVKSTGDGLMVVFPSASAAVDCAVAMQQALEHRNRVAGEPLRVRIGISLGEAEPAEGDYYGQSVVEAARLCAVADGGQILASEVVRTLGGGRGGHEFRPVGALELKGLDGTVTTCEVAWTPAAASVVPLPKRLVGGPGLGFFGRRAEAAVLDDAFKDAAAGTRRAVLIAGEPGIGKTRLMAEVARAAHEQGATVLYGRSEEDLGVPYQPFAEALRDYVEVGPVSVLGGHVERRGGELTRLVPELGQRTATPPPQSTNPEAERYLLFGAVLDLVERAAADAPVLLVLDDLHWADKPSLLLLRHLLASSDATRLLVVAAYREGDLGRDHPLVDVLAALRREAGVERLALDGLDDVDLVELLEVRSGRPLDDGGVALAHTLRRETNGNPFFVAEVLRHLAETGSIAQQEDGTWARAGELGEVGLPQSIREVVGRRVARLGETPLRVLSLAAVIGREFDLELLRRVAELDEDELLDILDAARQAALVEDLPTADRFAFAHGLIEHTLYEDLSAPRRQRAHRRVAEALEALATGDAGARAAELAYHWGKATAPTDAGKAIDYARQAGDHAMAQRAPDDAVRWYRQALTLTEQQARPDDAARCDLLICLGEAQRWGGDLEHEATLRVASELAGRLGSTDRLVRAVLAGERPASTANAWVPEIAERVEAALTRLGTEDSPARARLLAYLATAVEGFERRAELVNEAIAVARRVGDREVLCHALLGAVFALQTPSTLEARGRWSAEAVELATASGDPFAQLGAFQAQGWAFAERGDFVGFDRMIAAMTVVADRLSMPDIDTGMMTNLAWRSLVSARFEDAEGFITEGRAWAERIGYPGGTIMAGAVELALRRCQGRVAEVVDFLNQVADAMQGATRVNLDTARAFMYCELDDLERVRVLFEDIWARGVESLPYDQSWLSTLDMLAVMACALEHRPAAEELYARLAPWSDRIVVFGNGSGCISHYLGILATVLGRYDEADEHLAWALATHERLDAPYWAAQTRLALAQLLRVRPGPDPAGAGVLARVVLDAAGQHGFGTLERRAVALLDATP